MKAVRAGGFPGVVRSALALFAAVGCAVAATPVERATAENTLLVGSGPEVLGLDPQLVTGVTEFSILGALFEGLVELDGKTLAPVPGVAERWEISDEGRTVTFHLRADAKWSDGSALTAEDFVASYRRLLTPSLAAGYAYLLDPVVNAAAFRRGEIANFAQVGIAAPDARTLRFTLAAPAPQFLASLALPPLAPVPAAVIARHGGVASRDNRWTDPANFAGNGPFRLAEWRRNQVLAVNRSETYWDAAAVRLAAVKFFPTDSLETEERMFRAGQLHVTNALPIGRLAAHQKEHPEMVRNDTAFGTDFYRLNVSRPELADARVRRALALALDRRAIAQRVLRGARAAAGTLVPPGLPGYRGPEGVPVDFAEARRLLAEAGHAGGAGLPPIEILFNTSEQHRIVAEAVQAIWQRELGLEVRLQNQENSVVLQSRAAGEYQIVRSSWVGDYLDATSFLEVFAAGSANNHTRWTNAEYDRLLGEARATADPAARADLLRRAEELLLREAPIIPIYHNAHSYLILPAVRGWEGNLLNRRPWKGVSLAR